MCKWFQIPDVRQSDHFRAIEAKYWATGATTSSAQWGGSQEFFGRIGSWRTSSPACTLVGYWFFGVFRLCGGLVWQSSPPPPSSDVWDAGRRSVSSSPFCASPSSSPKLSRRSGCDGHSRRPSSQRRQSGQFGHVSLRRWIRRSRSGRGGRRLLTATRIQRRRPAERSVGNIDEFRQTRRFIRFGRRYWQRWKTQQSK